LKPASDPAIFCHHIDEGIYYTLLGTLRLREVLPTVYGDCRLVCAYGAYYLSVSETVPRREAEN
jgi:putative transposase